MKKRLLILIGLNNFFLLFEITISLGYKNSTNRAWLKYIHENTNLRKYRQPDY